MQQWETLVCNKTNKQKTKIKNPTKNKTKIQAALGKAEKQASVGKAGKQKKRQLWKRLVC